MGPSNRHVPWLYYDHFPMTFSITFGVDFDNFPTTVATTFGVDL